MTEQVHDIRPGLAALIVVTATGSFFFLAPLLPFGDTNRLALGGVFLSTAAGGYWASLHRADRRLLGWISALVGIVSFLYFVNLLSEAAENYRQNVIRCADIQRQIMSDPTHRSENADLFQAFHCQPSGPARIRFARNPKLENL